MVMGLVIFLLALSAAGSWVEVWLGTRKEPEAKPEEPGEETEREDGEEDRMRRGFLNLMSYGIKNNEEENR